MQAGYVFDKPRGYIRTTSGAVDGAVLISSFTFYRPGIGTTDGAGIPKGSQMLIIQPETQGIRMLDNGQTPTATLGYPLAAGAEFRYSGAMAGLMIISQVAGAIVNIWAFE